MSDDNMTWTTAPVPAPTPEPTEAEKKLRAAFENLKTEFGATGCVDLNTMLFDIEAEIKRREAKGRPMGELTITELRAVALHMLDTRPDNATAPIPPVLVPSDPAAASTATSQPSTNGSEPTPPARTARQGQDEGSEEQRPQVAWMAFLYVPIFSSVSFILWMVVANWTHVSTAIGDATGQPWIGGLFTFIIGAVAVSLSAIGAIKLAVSRKRRNSRRRTGAIKRQLRSFLNE